MASPQKSGSDLFARLKWSLLFRLIVVSIILASVIGFQIRENLRIFVPDLIALYLIVGLSYAISLVSLILIRKRRRLKFFAWVQVVWEVLFASTFIYLTGVWDSLFTFLYVLTIIISSVLLFRFGALISATASSMLYALEIFGVKYGWIPSLFSVGPEPDMTNLLRTLFLNVVALYAAALVTSYITEQWRRAGEELSQARLGLDRLEALNEAIVRSISTGLITIDQQGLIIFLNASAEKILGRSSDRLKDKPLSEVLPPPFYEKLTRDKSERVRLAYLNPEKKELVLECFWQQLQTAEGIPAGELLALADITAFNRMEERLKVADRLATVGKLAAGIAHEVRNPLGAISGSIELLKKESDPQSRDAHLMSIVLNETDRLNKLITDFLLYARPAPRSIQPVNARQLFNDLAEIARGKAGKVELVLQMEPAMIIHSDPRLIEQIFWNLVNNAIEAMAYEGKLMIKGRVENRFDRPGLWMSFEDTGSGIPAENLNKIFDPFFTTKDSGTGLGLATIWRIVQELNGEIRVENAPGRGARFEIWLPARPAALKEAASG